MDAAPGGLSQELGRVISLHRYPVKSLQGEAVEQLRFDGDHAVGDRQWALIDLDSGMTLSAKRWGQLLEASARTDPDGSVIITLPDDSAHDAADPATNDVLSRWLDRPVDLRRPGTAAPYELLADATDDESPIIPFAGPASHWADLTDAHFLTIASLAAAAALHPDGDWALRRFRPTALIEAPGAGFVEDTWVGSSVQIGDAARFAVFMPTVRCSLPTRAQPGLARDLEVARVLRDQHNFSLGVYAAARSNGVLTLGDVVRLLPE
jgi:uncharacterized protein YcbX